jgi:hypothetical protein
VSNSLSVAAITLALRGLLDTAVPALDSALVGLQVTTRTPDAARTNLSGPSLNLFLYRTATNAGWSNLNPPLAVRSGETGFPALALDLHYLLTAYGAEDTDSTATSHRALGAAMSVLHDHPLLDGETIRAALPGSDVEEQGERIRMSPVPLSVDDLSKLWSGFATQYRLSAAYVVSVVLIDSLRPIRSALPVLTRGQDDRGPVAVSGGGPAMHALVPPRGQAAVRLGEEVLVNGTRLTDLATVFRLASLLPNPLPPVELQRRPPMPSEPVDQVSLRVLPLAEDPDALGRWAPGFVSVTAVLTPPDLPAVVSNAVAMALAPSITVAPKAAEGPAAPGSTLTVTCAPRVRPGQRVTLLLAGRQLAPKSLTQPDPASPTFADTPTTVTFEVPDVPRGTYPVRLRVDGVDSIPVKYLGDPPMPTFDPDQQVSVP